MNRGTRPSFPRVRSRRVTIKNKEAQHSSSKHDQTAPEPQTNRPGWTTDEMRQCAKIPELRCRLTKRCFPCGMILPDEGMSCGLLALLTHAPGCDGPRIPTVQLPARRRIFASSIVSIHPKRHEEHALPAKGPRSYRSPPFKFGWRFRPLPSAPRPEEYRDSTDRWLF